jgi:hypothetical protein
MAKIYIPQLPSRFDTGSRLWIPTVNIEPARQFGEVVVMLPPNANRLHTSPLVAALREQMADYCVDDYVVALGDPSLIAAASCIAVRKTGGFLRILKWDRMSSAYIPVELYL